MQIKKFFLIGLTLLMASTSAYPQSKGASVTGIVIEDETKEPVSQATVQLLSLPDSSFVKGMATDMEGHFTLTGIKSGKYVLKVSFVGFKNRILPVQVTGKSKDVGILTLETDAVLLKEAVVTAEAPQVQVVEDTLVYNSSAYRTPEGAMLEELVKKLPGAEVDSEGNITINGKEVKKIMVNGKEFFGGDVKTGMKNLPVKMVEKLKTYDKKSDLARITGIDDGEEETVLDLTVKKGMNQGWFGNIDLAAGNKDRYSGRAMMNRFDDHSQITLLGSANNVNDEGFSGGGGGPRFRRNNGLTTTKMTGVSFATESEKLELGGSARYNYTDNDAQSTGYQENFLTRGNSFVNANTMARNKNNSFNADFRLEWKPDSMTNILLRPNLSYGKVRNRSVSESGTFSDDPYEVTDNPNDYLTLASIAHNDPLEALRINLINSGTRNNQKSLSTDATLQVNRKLSSNGRNITLRGRFGYGDNDNDNYTQSTTNYFLLNSYLGDDSVLIRNQFTTMPTRSYTYLGQLTYSEPIAKATYLQFSYQFQYKYNTSDRRTYDLAPFREWGVDDAPPAGYQRNEVDSLGKYANYKYFNHDMAVMLRFNRKDYQLSAGLSFQPQHTILSYRRGDFMIDTTRNVFNFSPRVDFRYRFSKVSQLRFIYRGNSSQPSMENLLPITDNSNPQNIRVGNPGLKPAFSHRAHLFFNDYDNEHQRNIMAMAHFNMTQNAISNSRTYNEATGGWLTQPKNIDGNWGAMGLFGYNTALRNKKFTIGSHTNVNYQNNVAYLTDSQTHVERKNTTTNLNLGERLEGGYRNDWFEFGLNSSINYAIERDKLTSANNQEPYTYSYGASTQVTFPWSLTVSTNIANQCRRGYTDSSMNKDEVIWNAQFSKTFLKGGAASISLEFYDILHQQSNIARTLTADGRSVYRYNGINSYAMLHFIYRLNIIGSKEARQHMRRDGFGGPPPGGGFGGGRPGGPPPGGFGGGRRF